jgi:WD40 repeat protein
MAVGRNHGRGAAPSRAARNAAACVVVTSMLAVWACGSDSTGGPWVAPGSGGSAAAGGAGGSSAGASANPPEPTTLVPDRLIAAPCRWLAPGAAQDVAFSPDGKLLATASGGFVKLYDAATGQQVRATPWHAGITRTFSFSPDGQRIAVGVTELGDPGVFVYRVSDMELVARLAEGRRASSVTYSADGRWLAAALTRTDPTDVVDVWNAADFTLEVEIAATNEHRLSAIGFHPDGSTLFALGYYSHEWSTATWQALSDPFQLSRMTGPGAASPLQTTVTSFPPSRPTMARWSLEALRMGACLSPRSSRIRCYLALPHRLA